MEPPVVTPTPTPTPTPAAKKAQTDGDSAENGRPNATPEGADEP